MAELEIDRLQKKARAGEPLTAREGLWLVEKVNQLRDALSTMQANQTVRHPAMMALAASAAQEAQLAASIEVGAIEPQRGNQWWAEWGLDVPADPR